MDETPDCDGSTSCVVVESKSCAKNWVTSYCIQRHKSFFAYKSERLRLVYKCKAAKADGVCCPFYCSWAPLISGQPEGEWKRVRLVEHAGCEGYEESRTSATAARVRELVKGSINIICRKSPKVVQADANKILGCHDTVTYSVAREMKRKHKNQAQVNKLPHYLEKELQQKHIVE
eukprot:m.266336 g.266336  ORF g.266336 m.266336 type:complete len:175 (+) comp15630_c0_seq5:143-667(+)